MSEFLTKHFINGIEIRPVNADEIGFKFAFEGDAEEAELNVDSIILANEAKEIVINWIDNGQGVFEGLPYTVMVGTVTLDYYIDLTEDPRISGEGDSDIEVNIYRRYAINQFKQNANALSFEALNKTHPITAIDVPYVIVRDNQLEMLIMLGISAYTLTKALIEGVRELVVAITDFIKITFVGTGVPVGQIIAAALLLIARIVYVAALTIALIDITKQIIELIFPPIRNLKGVTAFELMTKGAAKFNLGFKSTILEGQYAPLTFVPVTLKEDNKSIVEELFTLSTGFYNKSYPTARDTISTYGRLIDVLKSMFNADIRIVNGVLYLERRDYWKDQSNLTIINTLNDQSRRENAWRYNSGEWWKRYYIHYRTDVADFHTLDNIEKTDAEFSTEPVSLINQDLVNIKGLAEVPIPLAFGIRKGSLNFVEEVAYDFAKLADEVVQFFGGTSNLAAKIKGRIGVMQIGQQHFTVTKVIYQQGGRQPQNYLGYLGAIHLWNYAHHINGVKENFKRIYTARIPFSTDMFQVLINNNYVKDQDGNELEILNFEWINESKEAEITYAIESYEGQNTQTLLING